MNLDGVFYWENDMPLTKEVLGNYGLDRRDPAMPKPAGTLYELENMVIDHESLQTRVERLLGDPSCVRDALRLGYEKHRGDAQRNRSLLGDFVQARCWEPAPSVTLPHLAAA